MLPVKHRHKKGCEQCPCKQYKPFYLRSQTKLIPVIPVILSKQFKVVHLLGVRGWTLGRHRFMNQIPLPHIPHLSLECLVWMGALRPCQALSLHRVSIQKRYDFLNYFTDMHHIEKNIQSV